MTMTMDGLELLFSLEREKHDEVFFPEDYLKPVPLAVGLQIIYTPAVYPHLLAFHHSDMQSTGQKYRRGRRGQPFNG